MYLLRIPNADESNPNLFEEWIWIESKWEYLGAQEVDLVDYARKDEVPSIITEVLKAVYAVGSIYVSTTKTNPKNLFGFGTWTQIKDTFLLAAGDTYAAGTIGGEATHKLTVNEMPAHTHKPIAPSGSGFTNDEYRFSTVRDMSTDSVARRKVAAGQDYWAITSQPSQPDFTSNDIADSITTASTGGSKAHNNMPPYIAVYVWQRTA